MRLYNTLTRRLEPLKPLKPPTVSLYTCGPTVYDHVHIGNLRTHIFEDTLRRALKLGGYKLKHVMNITDVDDKTIKRSREQYPKDGPRAALRKLTNKYERIFYKDAQATGIDLADAVIVKATGHINDMQKIIKRLKQKGVAYVTDDGVYFSLQTYQSRNRYGLLAGRRRLVGKSRGRIAEDEYDKEQATDFALWKANKAGEPSWPFKINHLQMAGRPGWHIECSVMSVKYLGQPFDIHTGGVDLIFPHHENEIAQSTGAFGKPLANNFVHGEHLLVNGRKMSKRWRNFYVLDDLIKRGFQPLAFRLLVLQADYRSQLNFTWESLAGAQNFLQSLYGLADRQFQTQVSKGNVRLKKQLTVAKKRMLAALQHNLDTPQALSELGKLADFMAIRPLQQSELLSFQEALEFFDQAFGLNLRIRKDISTSHKRLIFERERLRQEREFAQADRIRRRLHKDGIAIEDTSFGPLWHRLL